MKTIALLTDLGIRDAYVGAMKGVIASIADDAQVLDITHQVPAHDLREAAFSLFTSYSFFPPGTIFCCVVDPGVGSNRRGVAFEIQDDRSSYTLVGPDNGLFTGAMYGKTIPEAVSLNNASFHLAEVSSTFHGRDIFAPVAAHLARGIDMKDLGSSINPESLVQLDWNEPREIKGGWEIEVIHADQFGNLVTNLPARVLKPDIDNWQVTLGSATIGKVQRTFSDVRPGHPLAYVGSNGLLELAIRDGNANDLLNIASDSAIQVTSVPVKF